MTLSISPNARLPWASQDYEVAHGDDEEAEAGYASAPGVETNGVADEAASAAAALTREAMAKSVAAAGPEEAGEELAEEAGAGEDEGQMVIEISQVRIWSGRQQCLGC